MRGDAGGRLGVRSGLRRGGPLAALAALLTALGCVAPGGGDPAGGTEDPARALYRRGAERLEAGRFRRALPPLRAAARRARGAWRLDVLHDRGVAAARAAEGAPSGPEAAALLREARESFRAVLRSQPDARDARWNLEVVERRLAGRTPDAAGSRGGAPSPRRRRSAGRGDRRRSAAGSGSAGAAPGGGPAPGGAADGSGREGRLRLSVPAPGAPAIDRYDVDSLLARMERLERETRRRLRPEGGGRDR